MVDTLKVRTVTYGRKRSVGRYGNAEYILTAEVREDQTVEDVMGALRKVVRCQLNEVVASEGEAERREC